MERYALVIGIGQYDGMDDLSKPKGDAIALEQVLKRAGWRVTCLNGCVTYDVLEKALKTFLERQAVGQDALIYFTGHGFMVEESEDDRRGYLATSDCAIEFEGKKIVSQRRGLSFGRLNGLIGRARLSSLVVLLDCCHGGLFVEDGLVKRSFQANPDQNFCWIAACRSFQQAYARGSETHSLFTGALLAALGESGEVTVLSVLRSVNAAFKQLALQEPIYIGAGKDIPLISPVMTIAAVVSQENPYQGLRAFTKETKQFFFGRDREIQTLVQKVQDCKFVPVIEASGSGKSSVVRAGLMPRLEELGWRVLEPMTPGTNPVKALQELLDRELPPACYFVPPEPVEDAKILLVVDQFEEVFTLCRDKLERSQFIQNLLNLWAGHLRLNVVVTMRADFVDACLANEGLTQVIRSDAVWLGPMTGADLEAAIEQPAITQGATLQPKLLAQILQDVAVEDNCLPLLEFALSALWVGKANQELTFDAYRKLGGVTGALNAHAEEVYKQLAKLKQEHWVQRVMLRLVRTGEGTKDTRQRQRKADLLDIGKDIGEKDAIESVIQTLVDGRLLVSDRVDNQDVIDLSHEALIRSWVRLITWREGNRKIRRVVDEIEDRYKEWLSSKEDESLLMGRLLRETKENWRVLESQVSQKIRDFYIKSLKHDKDYQISSTTTIRGHRSGVTDSCVLDYARLISLSKDKSINLWNVYTGKLIKHIDTIEHNGRIVIDPSRKILLILDNETPNHKSLMRFVELTDYTKILDCRQNNSCILEVCSGSKAGEFIYALDNGQIKKISILSKNSKKEGKNLLTISKGSRVTSMLFLEGIKALALATSDHSIEIYSLTTKRIIFTLKGHTQIINSLASSLDGRFLVSCSDDQTIQVWNLDTGFVSHTIDGHADTINSVSMVGNQYSIASASTDNTVKIWKLDENRSKYNCRYTLYEHTDWINKAIFFLNEDRIISLSEDKTIKYSNIKDRVHHSRAVKKIRLTLNDLLMSYSSDKTIKFWNTSKDKLVLTLSGDSPVLDSISINSGREILFTSTDNALRIWNLESQSIIYIVYTKYIVYSLEMLSNEQVILICGDKKLRVFDYVKRDFILDFEQGLHGLRAVSVPRIKGVIVAESDFVIRLRLVKNNAYNKHLLEFRGHESTVTTLSICQEQKLLASGDASGEIKVWNLRTGACIHTIQGHGKCWIYSLSVRYSNIRKNQIELLSSGDDQSLRLWHLAPGSVEVSIFNDIDNITSCILSENKIMFANHSGRVEWLHIDDFPVFS